MLYHPPPPQAQIIYDTHSSPQDGTDPWLYGNPTHGLPAHNPGEIQDWFSGYPIHGLPFKNLVTIQSVLPRNTFFSPTWGGLWLQITTPTLWKTWTIPTFSRKWILLWPYPIKRVTCQYYWKMDPKLEWREGGAECQAEGSGRGDWKTAENGEWEG